MDIYENTARELRNRTFEPFVIKELAEVSGNSLEIDDLMNLLLEKAMSATKAQIGSVCIFESDKQRLHIVASTGLEAELKKGFYINLNESLAEIVVSNREPFLVKDIETDLRTRRPNNSKYGLPSFLIMPICVRGDLIAVLNLAHKENKQIFSSDDERILSTVIGEAGISLENIWLHSTVDKYLKYYQKSIAKLNVTNRQLKQEMIRRRQLEAAPKEIETKYYKILESIEEGFFEVDLAGNVTFFNNSLCKMTGYSADELLGSNIREYITPETAGRLFKIIKNMNPPVNQIERSPVLTDCEFISKNKKIYQFILSSYLRKNQDGQPIGLYGIVHDVSRYLRAEREKEKLESQLRQAQKMQAVGTLAGGIAHDFNNMLQAITGNTQILLMQKKAGEPDYTKLKAIERSAMRASDLTRQLLIFGREVESELEPVNLNDEIKNTSKLLRHTIPKMINIELSLENDLNIIEANSIQLEQIIMNLAVNARDAMPDGGKLIFKTENVIVDESFSGITPGEYILFAVSDTGHGIDKRLLEHIFEPFYSTKQKGQGTGLGLAMVYSIVTSHNGHITCGSELGQGTTFKIYFPAIKSDVVENKEDNTWAEKMPRGNETILLVDDERALLDIGKEMLGRFGYTTIEAGSGEKALEIYKKEKDRIDLIILDLGMPGIGGYKCLKKLLLIDSQVKVIISSGYSAAEKVRETIDSGAVEFIEKPYQLGEILKKLRYVLGRGQQF